MTILGAMASVAGGPGVTRPGVGDDVALGLEAVVMAGPGLHQHLGLPGLGGG